MDELSEKLSFFRWRFKSIAT